MNFEIEYIEKLANLIDEKSLSEIILEDGEQAITIKREINQTVVQSANPVAIMPQTPQVQSAKGETVQENTSSSKGTPITSPMVGAFYAAPSPGAKPFVKVGDVVSAGQVVCIVEAMKLMNEIESEVSGKVTQICVEDGQSVEYGQVLMYIE
ncbi:TPA: acetyl-CoA carboxylase biotin carboxyl carrier protein [Candidatus Galligastranaerophilus intestinavium]|uniref:Biotin carboxyl carrier protein of acetyl-CoA carboxylase n=1 Tax=Candidatus Galligastranaerophilus intestinavium TaxID=2840836 RepID=A0A9D1FH74_9BACT|nr:acetyl-CoA carboxylase biotin carboxyl carrier protein [Candidatus Galligastranaerophilus intestinavium]